MRHKPGILTGMYELQLSQVVARIQEIYKFKASLEKNTHELSAVAMLAAWLVTQRDFRKTLEDNLVRSIVKILHQLGDSDPLTVEYRQFIRLQSLSTFSDNSRPLY